MKNIWWLNPGKLILFFVLPMYAFVVYVVPFVWPELIVLKAGLYVQGHFAHFGALLLAGMGMFGMVGAKISVDSRQSGSSVAIHPAVLGTMGTLTIAAYMIWFGPVITSGGAAGDRASLNQMPGVTSFSQVGIPFVVCYLTARLVAGQQLGRGIRFMYWFILFLTVARVHLWGERLAAIEIIAPLSCLILTHSPPRTRAGHVTRKIVGAAGPFLAIPALLAVFTITEFFRSWTVYSQTQRLPLMEFMSQRLTTYYFTALNNGAGLLATQQGRWPTFDFFYTAQWFYSLPAGIGEWAWKTASIVKDSPTGEFLDRFADPEFNNMSGMFPIIYDLGYVAGFLYFCTFGLIAGILYKSMINGRALGMVFYPPMFTACVEVMRISYLNGSRAVLMTAGCVAAYLHIRASRANQVRRAHISEISRAFGE